jgi:hypothetical protein
MIASAGTKMSLGTVAAGTGYLADRASHRRTGDAIKSASLIEALIAQQEAAAQDRFDNERAASLTEYLDRMAANQGSGAGDAAARRAEITAATGPTGQGLGSSDDGLAASLYRLAQERQRTGLAAEDAGQAVSLGQRAVGMSERSSRQRTANAQLPLLKSRREAAQQRLLLQQWLGQRLNTPSAHESRMRLVSGLSNAAVDMVPDGGGGGGGGDSGGGFMSSIGSIFSK